jgi:putative iron-only hydrogenase system regulator
MHDVIAGITLLVEDRQQANLAINGILSQYAALIHGRMGIPHLHNERSVIALILQGPQVAIDSLVCELTDVEAAKGFRTILARFDG